MKMTKCIQILIAVAVMNGALPLFGQGTAFTYQGQLVDASAPANGSYDLTFTLFTKSNSGTQFSGTLTNTNMEVSNGLFLVVLDFGNAFDGTPRWLEIAVRPGGSNDMPFTTLAPRQPITAAPYALYAKTADAMNGGSLVSSNSTTLAGTIQFSGNSAANGYIWTATDTNGTGVWKPAISGGTFNPTNLNLYGSTAWHNPTNNTLETFDSSYSNATYNGGWRFRNYSVPNSLGDPQYDNVWQWGFNLNYFGSPSNTNQPSFFEQLESCWQNQAGYSQTEWWWGWYSPMSVYGTNFSFRPFGMGFLWNTADKTFASADGNFIVDKFYFGNPRQPNYTPISFVTSQAADNGQILLNGYLTTRTNGLNNGGVVIQGGDLKLKDSAGNNFCQLIYSTADQGLDITASAGKSIYLKSPVVFSSVISNAVNVVGQMKVQSATFPPAGFYRQTTANVIVGGLAIAATNIAAAGGSGLGVASYFQLEDNSTAMAFAGCLGADWLDNSKNSELFFAPVNGGADPYNRKDLRLVNAGTNVANLFLTGSFFATNGLWTSNTNIAVATNTFTIATNQQWFAVTISAGTTDAYVTNAAFTVNTYLNVTLNAIDATAIYAPVAVVTNGYAQLHFAVAPSANVRVSGHWQNP